MSAYRDFTSCITSVVEQFESHVKYYNGDTIGDFFNHDAYIDLVNDIVVTYHEEIFSSAGNNFLRAEQVPEGIVKLAKKRGVVFPRGFSIEKDVRACDIFLIRVKDYRESRGLTKKRVKEIRDQNRENVKRLRM